MGKGLDSMISSRYIDEKKATGGSEKSGSDSVKNTDSADNGAGGTAKVTAESAKGTAESTKGTAESAKGTAESAKVSEKSATSAGNSARSAEDTVKSAGDTAKSAGSSAKSTGTEVAKPGSNVTKSAGTTTVKPVSDEGAAPGEPFMLRVSQIEPNRSQPRQDFDEAALEELASSIRRHGVLQPILVRKAGRHYEIIAGERRWRAAKLAKLKEIPAIVKDFDDSEATEIALIENIQREDLNPVEEALAYQRLINDFYLTQEQVAERVGKSREAVANRVRLLKLAPEVREMLISGKISEGHARALLRIEIPELQVSAAQEIIDRGLTVREAEKLAKRMLSPVKPSKKEEFSEADRLVYEKLEEELRFSTGTKVEIHRNSANRGKIVLDYYSMEELERLIDMFRRFKGV